MNLLAKMMTALKGGAMDVGEAIADSQVLRILDQEVRETSENLKSTKNALAEIIARQKLSEEKVSVLQQKIEEHEGYVIKALDKSEDILAREVAEKISEMDIQLVQEKELLNHFVQSANKLRATVLHTERNLKRLRQQVDTVKATESVQRAQEAIALRCSGNEAKIATAMDSLKKIKERQALNEAKLAAADELEEMSSEKSLQLRLQKAGITSGAKSADDILEKIKNKNSPAL